MKEQVGAATSITAASVGWLATFNEIVQIVAGLVAIAAGLITVIPWFHKKLKEWKNGRR